MVTAVDAWERKHDRELRFGIGWEMQQMLAEIDPDATNAVLEIGTFQGDSLRVWRAVLNPTLLVGVQDTDETTPETAAEVGATMIRGKSQDDETFNEVLHALSVGTFGPELYSGVVYGRPTFDFLYIDGDHHYEAVKRDWELYSPLVRPGGIIILHDAVIEDNPTVEVYRLYRELRDGRRSKLIYAGQGSTGTAIFFT